jgi:hypothetical protein
MDTHSDAIKSAASALGKQAAGIPKRFSPEELERRRKQMTQINEDRKGTVQVAKGTVKRLAVSSGSRMVRKLE